MDPGIYIISGLSPAAQNPGDFGYFGLSVHPEVRLDQHLSALRRGKHSNALLQGFYDDRGKNQIVYDIVEECDLDQLADREKFFIREGRTYENPQGFNLTPGGEGVGLREGKLYGFIDTRFDLSITGQNIAQFQRANPQFELEQLYRLSRGEIDSYQHLKLAPWSTLGVPLPKTP